MSCSNSAAGQSPAAAALRSGSGRAFDQCLKACIPSYLSFIVPLSCPPAASHRPPSPAQCQGAINDYCRYIGSPGDAWWSCALAGGSEQYSPRGRYSEASSSPLPCLDFSVAERHPTPPAGVPSRLDRMATLMAQRRARQAQERARAQKEEEERREAAAVEASIFGSLFGRRAQPGDLPQQQGSAAGAGAGRSPWMRVSAADGAAPMSIWSVSVVEVWWVWGWWNGLLVVSGMGCSWWVWGWWDGRLVVVAEEWWAATHAGSFRCQCAAVGLDVHIAEEGGQMQWLITRIMPLGEDGKHCA